MADPTPACDLLMDNELELVLEGKISMAINEVRARVNVSLRAARDTVKAAEEELGLMEDRECTGCAGKGAIRARKREYGGI